MLKYYCQFLGSLLLSASILWALWWFLGHPQEVPGPKLNPDSKLQCVSYTPYRGEESPFNPYVGLRLSTERLNQDLGLLARHFDCIRIYSVTGMERLPLLAQKHGLKILLGAWVGRDPQSTHEEIRQAIALAKKYPQVIKAVVVGNEALLRKEISGTALASLIKKVKKELPSIPVTYADVWEFWEVNPEVAPVVDFITIHILPYWENDPHAIEFALTHVKNVREDIVKSFPEKPIFIGETGWPSRGRMREGALPSPVNQARFIRGFVDMASRLDWEYNLIEAFDQPWKRLSEGGVGGYWGLFDTHRKDKGSLFGKVSWFQENFLALKVNLALALLAFFLVCKQLQKKFLKTSLAISFFSFLLVLDGVHSLYFIRNSYEWGFKIFIWSLGLLSFWLTLDWILFPRKIKLYSLKELFSFLGNKPVAFSQTPFDTLHLLMTSITFVGVTLAFVFDGRYRLYEPAALTVPVCFWLWVSLKKQVETSSLSLKDRGLWGLLIGCLGLGLLLVETPLNFQSNVWLLLLCGFYYVWSQGFKGSLIFLKTVFQSRLNQLFLWALFLGYPLALLIRYGLMESHNLTNQCFHYPGPLVCAVRDTLGMTIHFRFWPKLALILFLGAFLGPLKKVFVVLSGLFIMAGFVLYNVDWAVPAFFVSFLLLQLGSSHDK